MRHGEGPDAVWLDYRLAMARFGGSPLRAAGGQPCWNAWPGQTRPLQSLQRTQPNPRRGLALFSVT
jgi:hypothetical protein